MWFQYALFGVSRPAFSDHTRILLTTALPKPRDALRFKYELRWPRREGFHDMVQLLVILVFKGGIIRCVQHAHTLLVELDTQVFLLKMKSNGSEMSLMTLRC
jgi:hypothetical protein